MSFYERPQPEYVLAMHDYIPDQRNATCLGFRAGQVVRVLNRDPSGWWDGELDGSRGWFPSNYVNGDLALLADEQLPHFVSVSPFNHFLVVIELTYYIHIAKAVTIFSFTFSYIRLRQYQYPFVSTEPLLSR